MKKDAWDLLRAGETDGGLSQMRERYAAESNTSHAMELGVALFWLADYRAAFQHFQAFNERYPHHASVTYGMAGTAKWCLNRPNEAIGVWREGVNCDFARSGVNIDILLLLGFSAVMRSNRALREEVERLLAKRLTGPGVKHWPGPLAEFMLGRLDEQDLRSRCVDTHPDETLVRQRTADFYIGVAALDRGDSAAYIKAMQSVASLSWNAFDASRDAFLSRIWYPEFYLARYHTSEIKL